MLIRMFKKSPVNYEIVEEVIIQTEYRIITKKNVLLYACYKTEMKRFLKSN